MIRDGIVKIGSSIVQHGKYNDRIYIMKLDWQDCPAIIDRLEQAATENSYSKIFAKVPSSARKMFTERNYVEEASIPGFFKGQDDVFFMSKFLDPGRSTDSQEVEIAEVLAVADENAAVGADIEPTGGLELRACERQDAGDMALLYRKVFSTYPFPIYDPDFIMEAMEVSTKYFGAWLDNILAGLSSAEMDEDALNVEMTDFAVLPEYRGKHVAVHLLRLMEDEMRHRGCIMAYTKARSLSYGMNITFSKLGYDYAGTLVNNTNIGGGLESMNVWFKPL